MATLTLKKTKTLTLKKNEKTTLKVDTSKPKTVTFKEKTIELNDLLCSESSIWSNYLPLRISIDAVLLKRKELRKKYGYGVIRATIKAHTLSNRYLNNTVIGGNRFNIDGSPNGLIFEKARTRAVEILKSRGAGVIFKR